jgi:5-methylcytosine-specific restriction endonuclease McrA
LHLREGAAGRRIAAMRVLRRLPSLAQALRDGRVCLSTVALLGPLLTEENLDEMVERAAYRTKAEVEQLVVSLQPRSAPKDGVRRVPERRDPPPSPALQLAASVERVTDVDAPAPPQVEVVPPPPPPPRETPPSIRPVAAATYSLRVTVDARFKADLDQLTSLLSHKVPDGDLAAVLHEALRCAIDKHGKRQGAVEPSRKAKPTRQLPQAERGTAAVGGTQARRAIAAAVRREVWRRDGGRCAWVSPDGHRCGSTWQLELDHIRPFALGGAATVDNLTLRCRTHNRLHAEETFGRAYMQRFRREGAVPDDSTSSGESDKGSATAPG